MPVPFETVGRIGEGRGGGGEGRVGEEGEGGEGRERKGGKGRERGEGREEQYQPGLIQSTHIT